MEKSRNIVLNIEDLRITTKHLVLIGDVLMLLSGHQLLNVIYSSFQITVDVRYSFKLLFFSK